MAGRGGHPGSPIRALRFRASLAAALPFLVALILAGCAAKPEAPMPFDIARDTREGNLRVLRVLVPKPQRDAEKLKELARYIRDQHPGTPIGMNFFDETHAARQPVRFGHEDEVSVKNESFWLHYLAHYEYHPSTGVERFVALAPLDNPH